MNNTLKKALIVSGVVALGSIVPTAVIVRMEYFPPKPETEKKTKKPKKENSQMAKPMVKEEKPMEKPMVKEEKSMAKPMVKEEKPMENPKEKPMVKEEKPEVSMVEIKQEIAKPVMKMDVNLEIAKLLKQADEKFSAELKDKIEELIIHVKRPLLKNYFQKQLEYLEKKYETQLATQEAAKVRKEFEAVVERLKRVNISLLKDVKHIFDARDKLSDSIDNITREEIELKDQQTLFDNLDYIHLQDLKVDLIGRGFKTYSSFDKIDLSDVEHQHSFRKLSDIVDPKSLEKNYLIQFSVPRKVLSLYGPRIVKTENEDELGIIKSKTLIKMDKIIKRFKDGKIQEIIIETQTPEHLLSVEGQYLSYEQIAKMGKQVKPDYYPVKYSNNFKTQRNAELTDKRSIIASYLDERQWFNFFISIPKDQLKELAMPNELPYDFRVKLQIAV